MNNPVQAKPLGYLQGRRQIEARIHAVRENQPERSSAETYAQMDRMKGSERSAGEPARANLPDVETLSVTRGAAGMAAAVRESPGLLIALCHRRLISRLMKLVERGPRG